MNTALRREQPRALSAPRTASGDQRLRGSGQCASALRPNGSSTKTAPALVAALVISVISQAGMRCTVNLTISMVGVRLC